MSKEVKEVHFTLDESAGVLIMNIAQEHLLYNYSPSRAVESIKNILIGCPDDLALAILNGDKVIYVETDEETGHQELMVSDRTKDNESIFPRLAIDFFAKHNIAEIVKDSRGLINAVEENMNRMKYSGGLVMTHRWSAILNLTQGIDADVLEEIKETDEYQNLALLTQVLRDFITRNTKKLAVIDFCNKTWNYTYDTKEANRCVFDVANAFSKLLREEYIKLVAIGEKSDRLPDLEAVNLDAYIQSAMESDAISKEGIEPVDIMNNYSAGWLSPDGTFYGLNGQIANMLHIQIADMLQEAGQIPMYKAGDDERYFLKKEEEKRDADEINPSGWLEEQGWVKVHGNNIQFAGCLNSKIGKKNVQMTNAQIEVIYKYIQVCHSGIVRLGWKMEKISAPRFQMIAQDRLAMNKAYFNF
jgi:hypothetical protein